MISAAWRSLRLLTDGGARSRAVPHPSESQHYGYPVFALSALANLRSPKKLLLNKSAGNTIFSQQSPDSLKISNCTIYEKQLFSFFPKGSNQIQLWDAVLLLSCGGPDGLCRAQTTDHRPHLLL